MAENDIKVLKSHYGVQRFRTEANVTVGILPGDCVIKGGTGSNYAGLLLDGMPTQGTDVWIGVTRSTGTNTTAVDGTIQVEIVGPGSILEGRATTASLIDTDAELLGILNDYKNFDRTAATVAGVLTIDQSQADAMATLSLMVLDGDIVKGTLRVACVNSSIWTGTM